MAAITAARILNGVVVEIVALPEGVTLTEAFHQDAGFIACANDVTVGMLYSGGAYSAAPAAAPLPPPLLTQLANAQAAGCQIVSTGTPALSGTYAIDPQSETWLIGLQAGIAATPPASWAGFLRDNSGVKHVMTAAQFTTLAEGVLGYVEALDEAYETAVVASASSITIPAQPVTIA